mmetsp:Transcript_27679/g.44285  ORF Transcript_27679/g.44285 Transcript_27679/m.44285 type:complete len:1064 (-) Transcript_27679:793-3984(-)
MMEALGRLLLRLQDNSNDARAEAERELLSMDPVQVTMELLRLVVNAGEQRVRKAACVVLGAFFVKSDGSCGTFGSLSESQKETVCSGLIRLAASEDDWAMLRPLSNLIGQLAGSLDDVQAEWPQVGPAVLELLCSSSGMHKESGLVIFRAIAKDLVMPLEGERVVEFCEILKSCLWFSERPGVQVGAIEAVSAASCHFVGEDSKVFSQRLTPVIFQVIRGMAQAPNRQEDFRQFLEGVCTLCETTPRVFKQNLAELSFFMLTIISTQEFPAGVRCACIEILVVLAERLPWLMRQLQLAPLPNTPATMLTGSFSDVFVKTVLRVIINNVQSNDEFGDEEKNDCVEAASTGLARVCGTESIGPVRIVPTTMACVTECLQQTNAWQARYAGLVALTQIAQALFVSERGMTCLMLEKGHVGRAIEWFVTFAGNDGNGKVRYASLSGLGTFCSIFASEIHSKCHKTVIQTLLKSLEDPFLKLRCRAAEVLQVFLDGCDYGHIQPFYNVLLEKLFVICQQSTGELQQTAVSTISSLIKVRGTENVISTHYAQWKGALGQVMSNSSSELLGVMVLECLSALACRVNNRQDCLEIMRLLKGFGENENHQWVIQCWENISTCLEPGELSHLIPELVAIASKKIEYDEDLEPVRTFDVDNKISVCLLLRKLCSRLKAGFIPFIRPVFELFKTIALSDPHPDMRSLAASVFPELVASLSHTSHIQQREPVAELIDLVLPLMIEWLSEEEDIQVELAIVMSIKEIIVEGIETPDPGQEQVTYYGGCLTENQLVVVAESFMSRYRKSLQKRELLRAQLKLECGDAGPDEDMSETFANEDKFEEDIRFQLVEGLSEISALYHTLFNKAWVTVLRGPMLDLGHPDRLELDRFNAIYIIVDIIDNQVTGFDGELLTLLLQNADTTVKSGHPSELLLQGIAFGLGVCVKRWERSAFNKDTVAHIAQVLLSITSTLEPGSARENAIASCGKVVRYCGSLLENGEQLGHLVSLWVNNLPFQFDLEESKASLEDLLLTRGTENPVLAPFREKIAQACYMSMQDPDNLVPAGKQDVVEALALDA